jgi:ABC-type multidrug transport system fused ATPase/permease subunit
MAFFESNPTGRILSRFSEDFSNIDTSLPMMIQILVIMAVTVTFGLILAIISIWWIIIPLVPVAIIYLLLQQFYRKTSRELKRLSSLARSPLFSHVSESFTGIETIRSSNQIERFKKLIELAKQTSKNKFFF